MKWTDMIFGIVGMLLATCILFGMGYCVRKAADLKLECMKLGKSEAECRNFN